MADQDSPGEEPDLYEPERDEYLDPPERDLGWAQLLEAAWPAPSGIVSSVLTYLFVIINYVMTD
jgi:hypothetical protein